jgi:hypothetical protein
LAAELGVRFLAVMPIKNARASPVMIGKTLAKIDIFWNKTDWEVY